MQLNNAGDTRHGHAAGEGHPAGDKNSLSEKDGREKRERTDGGDGAGEGRPPAGGEREREREREREKRIGRGRMTDSRPVKTSPVKTAGKERETHWEGKRKKISLSTRFEF
jgi:hypothetical protein